MKTKDDTRTNEWISVKKRLPEEWEPVLGAIGTIVEVVIYIGNGKWRVTWNHDAIDEITHWMPLPDPPEVEE